MKTIENFILGLNGQQKAIVSFLHNHLCNEHGLHVKINYGIPMYYQKSSICYLNPIKKDGVELAFTKGYLLSNVQEILQIKDRKYVAGIELFDIRMIPISLINQIIQEAVILDQISKS